MESVFSVLQVIGILFLVLMVFNVIILIHEWGHFLAARWRGLEIEKFQIWFGKPIWKKTINGVQYGLGCIPAGGFVALPQMAPMEAIEGGTGNDRKQLPGITPLDKIIVAFAGPLFSFLLAVVFACVVWIVGKPVSSSIITTEIGWVHADMPAGQEGGLKPGDVIKKIDGVEIKRFHGMIDSVIWSIVSSRGEKIIFDVERDGAPVSVAIAPKIDRKQEDVSWWAKLFKRPDIRKVGIEPKETPMVGEVYPGSPAETAGIKENDLILELNGSDLYSTRLISNFITENPGKPFELKIGRGEETLKLQVTSQKPTNYEQFMAGIRWDAQGKRHLDHPSPYQEIKNSLRSMGSTLSAVFSPKSDIGAGHLSGPAGIMRVYYNLFKDPQGWRLVLWFSILLNVNLAVLNMLPFPVLDGGHITMAFIEILRKKPINIRLLEYIQLACVMMLFGFIIFVTMKDAGDIFPGGGDKSEKPESPGDPIFSEPSPAPIN